MEALSSVFENVLTLSNINFQSPFGARISLKKSVGQSWSEKPLASCNTQQLEKENILLLT